MLDDARLIEEAADELGRLEAIAGFAPQGVSVALRLVSIAQLVSLESPRPSPVALFAALAAAEGDPLHDADLPSQALHWRALVESEERRVRSGAPLTSQRFAIVAPTLSTYTDRPQLEAIWRETGFSRPVLVRALDAVAWSPTPALGEACAALMLCAGGRADRVRLLPFADATLAALPDALPHAPTLTNTRDSAIAAWRAGDPSPWTQMGLASAARRARAARVATERLLRALGEDEARLHPLGRAAINARRALATLRERFVIAMPSLAEVLELSRPAASDALERLVAAGLAREVTGRARDRVYAWDAACSVAAAVDAPTGS